ncbi:MAG TPA: sugar ABC transporter ATP-binding protein [Planctomycetaceae bacterium]|jgi:ABC-type sugar transport system ATPase subunit|nr:sugar ABC transporter ATP-binding protein [Planctomycetaceae bacterium]
MQPILSVRGVGRTFGSVVALDDVSFDIRPGETHAIMGENGAGKSTLMKILAGVQRPTSGELLVRGRPVSFAGTREAEAAGISMIHQELNLVEQLSVSANIFLGRELTNGWGVLQQGEMDRRAAALLEQLETPISPRALVGSLRVGDQQLVEIARALSLESDILIMDEPTSALTESEVVRLYRVADRLKARGVTILYISHRMDEVFRLADRITVLRDGRFVTTVDRAVTSAREVAHWMVGRELAPRQRRVMQPLESGSEPVLRVQNLSLPWAGRRGRWRLHNISFSLHKGEILGLAGLMGAGRTELLECLSGAASVRHTGEIRLHGERCHFRHPAEAMRAGIALATEDRKRLGIFRQMTVRENMTISALSQFSDAGVISGHREQRAVQQQTDSLGIRTAGSEAMITSLSGGNQQKCMLARCLLTKPEVLLLDDPTRGVDVGAKSEIYRLMDQLSEQGVSMIVTSGELPELLAVCDRILVLSEGHLTGRFSATEATEQLIMEAATAGRDGLQLSP